jgi:DnaJ family protein B protein 5
LVIEKFTHPFFRGDPMRMFAQAFGNSGLFTDFGFGGSPGGTEFIFGDDAFGFNMGPGMGMGGGHRRARQDPTVEHELLVSLEDIYKGCTKKMKITRKVIQPDGTHKTEDKVLTINIKPGWKSGTKITFPKEGDQLPGRVPADIAFVIKDKLHPKFKREGADIRYVHRLALRDALCGATVQVPTLDGTAIPLPMTNVLALCPALKTGWS